MKTPWLVRVHYSRTQYMGTEHKHDAIHVVQASDWSSAYAAAKKHYEDQTMNYDVYYKVFSIECFEMIEGS